MNAPSLPSRTLDAALRPGIFRLFLATVVVLQHFTTFSFGKWAVYVFFMLSGYWISVIYTTKYEYTRNSAFTFIVSRFWRLFPLYLVTTVLGGLILRLSSRHWPEFSFVYNPWWILRELIIVSSSDQPMLMNPTWSLDIEMQFYLIAPIVILWMTAARPRVAFSAMAAAALACIAFWKGGDLPRYIAPFFAGMLIFRCRWTPSRTAALASFGATALAVCVALATPAGRGILIFNPAVAQSDPNHYLCLALALLITPYVAFTVHQPGTRLDRHFGNLAYSVYLAHGCVFVFCIYFAGYHDRLRSSIGHMGWLLVPIASLAVYLLVDQPSERLRNRFVNERRGARRAVFEKAPPLADPAS